MSKVDTLQDVPEFFETNIGESIEARTGALGTFRELGPPDLCHIIKTDRLHLSNKQQADSNSNLRQCGSYHYVSGVPASSQATLAAYFVQVKEKVPKGSTWEIRAGVHCCYNAFSRVDVRVESKTPGGIESYYVDVHGQRHPNITEDIWMETHLSALLRAILYSDDSYFRLAGFRKLNPINTLNEEKWFLDAAESLFWKGSQLGSKPEIQTATSVHNHLTSAIMKYAGDSFRYGPVIELFEKLQQQDPEVGALLAEAYIGQNEETMAVETLYNKLQLQPQSYSLLHAQIEFLRGKGEFESALELAKFAVNSAPSEFLTWAKLTEVYIDLADYKKALLSLNSCPMFTYSERDMHSMPVPAKTHLPIKSEIQTSGVMDEDPAQENKVDETLAKLPAPALHGTFAKAYSLLTQLASKIGWDDLLKYRSQVFVMEEEYRMQKAKEDVQKSSFSQSSTTQKESPHNSEAPDTVTEPIDKSSKTDADLDAPAEGTDEASDVATSRLEDENQKGDDTLSEKMDNVDLNDAKEEEEETKDVPAVKHRSLERPQQAAEDEERGEPSTTKLTETTNSSFSAKRLCERWLDNLFMVLYEDLRVYTFWRTEAAHYRAQHMPYRKTGAEWEALGDLALRLWHENEAKEAYETCLNYKFSARAWLKLLEIYSKEGNVEKSLLATVKLTVYHQRWYHEIVCPTEIARNLNSLIRKEGLSKVQNMATAMNLPPTVNKLVRKYFDYGKLFQVEGSDTYENLRTEMRTTTDQYVKIL